MTNIHQNRINTTMTATQVANVKQALQTILSNMPFLTGLSETERIALPKMNVSNKVFVEDTLNAAANNAGLLPTYLSIANTQTDYTLFEQLEELQLLVNQLSEKIDDTRLLAGSEAYGSALVAYRLFGGAAEAGVAGADTIYTQLRARFSGQGGSGNTPPPTDSPSDT